MKNSMRNVALAVTLAIGLVIPTVASANPNNPNTDPTASGYIWRSNSFQSPSGNIKCHYWAYDDELTCTTLNTGLTMYLTRFLAAGHRYAHLAEGHGPTLLYGQHWVVNGFRCDSYSIGMNCHTTAGHGFLVNRTDYNVW